MIKNIKGTRDEFPNSTNNLQDIERHLAIFMALHGYGEIRTPIFESTELFKRSVGEHTDIVSKEMYTWTDINDKSLTLRPEMTASVIRSYIQNKIWKKEPSSKYYYIGPAFRRERPQKGRYRQFHQFGIEAIGSPYPEQDAEVISMAYNIYKMFGIENLSIKLNSLGSENIRIKYVKSLKETLMKFENDLEDVEKQKLENNPLRILDSKNKNTQKIISKHAPVIMDFITKEDEDHFTELTKILDSLSIPYEHDPKLVRGLDYYTRTTFEIISDSLGAQDALCGGGRYDGLISQLGGDNIPAVGFAAGIERLLLAMKLEQDYKIETEIYFIVLDKNSLPIALDLADQLRSSLGIQVYLDTLRRSLKAQMRHANKMNANFVIIMGDEELKKNKLIIKNMEDNAQQEVPIEKILSYFESED